MSETSETTSPEPARRHDLAAPRVLDTRALRALGHPLRIELFDLITQYGPQTASTLAAMTGESSGATSYHLRELAKHDLLEEDTSRGTGRERWWRRPPGMVSFGDGEVWSTPAGRAAGEVVMSEFLNRRQQTLLRFMSEKMEHSDEWCDTAIVDTVRLRMTLEQFAELSREVTALINAAIEKYHEQTGEGVRPVTVRADIFPLPEETPS